MPSTENATLQRIQQEIKESVQREEELRKGYSHLNGNNGVHVNGSAMKPMLVRAQSTSVLNEPELPAKNGFRRFTPNPHAKGVMHKFIKSRGKLNVSSIQNNNNNNINNHTPLIPWNGTADIIEPAKIIVDPGKCIRKGYVPIEQRMRQELQEYSEREKELRNERKKSQPNLMALLDTVESPQPPRRLLKGARSMSQLYDPEELPEDTVSAPSSLKPARSLAQLIDGEEAVEVPGTLSLILQFENLNQRNGHAS